MNNILISSAGKRVVLVKIFQQTARDLHLDVKVYTADMRPGMAPACIVSDGSFLVPPCTDVAYIDRLLEICHEHDIGVVIPTIDTELLVLARNREKFLLAGIDVVLSDECFVMRCRDKRNTLEFFSEMGIRTPKAVDKTHPVYPMFAKPYDGSLSVNTHVIRSKDDLTRDILNDPKMLFMEYIDKHNYKEFSVDMYYGRDCYVKGIVPRERIEVRAGEINKGITRKNCIVDYLKQRMDYLPGVRGCICLQLFYRESDHDVLGIEINPRFGGGFPLSYYAKANFADYMLHEYLLDKTIDYSDDWLGNTLMLRYDNDVIVHDSEI